MTLNQIKNLHNSVISNEQFEQLQESEYITYMENIGYSSSCQNCYWYDIKLADGDNIDIFIEKEQEDN